MRRLSVIFTTSHADTVGNIYRLNIIRVLNRKYVCRLYTNTVGFLANRFPECEIKKIDFREPRWFWSRKARGVAHLINADESDVVFMFHDTSLLGRLIEKPLIQLIHQYGRRTPTQRIASRIRFHVRETQAIKSYKKTDLLFVVSGEIRKKLARKGICNVIETKHFFDEKLYQNPPLRDAHISTQEKKKNSTFIALYSGWLCESRGLGELLDTAEILRDEGRSVCLVLVGANIRQSGAIDEIILRRNLGKHVLNVGLVEYEDIPGFLALADVSLSILKNVEAHKYSLPQKVAESFCAGKAVIANDINVHRRLIRSSVNGLLVGLDPKEIARAIALVQDNPSTLNAMGQAAAKTGMEYWESNCATDLYRNIDELFIEIENLGGKVDTII